MTYALRLFDPYRPRWTKPFLKESKQRLDELNEGQNGRPSYWAYGLLSISLIGCAAQTVTVFFPSRQIVAAYPSLAWGVAVAIILVERPRTAPISLLVLFVFLLLSQLVVLSHTYRVVKAQDTPLALALVSALCGILIILRMPLRDPQLPKDDISRPYGTPTSNLRSPEDNLTPWQYMSVSWLTSLISVGVKKQINDEDVWDLPYEFKHRRLHNAFRNLQGSVTRRLLQANGMDLVFTTSLGLVELTATLLTPVLLQRLLASMENPNSPRSSTITYACISLALRLVSAQAGVFKLWYSRRTYERSRGEMITMLYEKTLNRKIIGATQQPKAKDDHKPADQRVNSSVQSSKKWYNYPQSILKRVYEVVVEPFRSKNAAQDSQATKEGASSGKILNLMRNDAYEIAQRFWDFPDFVVKPLGAIFAMVLIWRLLGWSCFLGILALVAAQAVNVLISRCMIYWEKKRRVATDIKLQKVTQFIDSIRHLRWYGWQDTWLQGVMDARQKELNLRIIQLIFFTSLQFITRYGSGLFLAVAFWAFTSLAGRPLYVDLIFPAIDLFNLLEEYLRAIPGLVTVMLNAYVAMGRIEEFMKEPDKEESEVVPSATTRLELRNASFAWPGVSKNVLKNITLTFPVGLTVVYGEVAAGKTALLQALLGELDKTEGEFIRPDETIGYCAQAPWLQSMSIRDNILFASPYEEVRYRQTLDACALVPDMANLKHGDLSNIGENGIGLSGGQKARVALARAVYSKSSMLFLDDPLSALDHQTAEYIVRKLLSGPLLEDRTTLLVTHRTDLCYGLARQWVELDKGKATIHEPSEDSNNNVLHSTRSNETTEDGEAKKKPEDELAAVADKFIEEEKRAHGGVKLRVYWRYIKAGTRTWWSLAVLVVAIYRVGDVAMLWFIKAWGEGYNEVQRKTSSGFFDSLPPPAVNIRPWLIWFFWLTTVTSILYWWTFLLMFGVGYQAAKTIFAEAVDRVAHATFRFYDTTPVGRLMNRLTSDMNTIDSNLSIHFTLVAWQLIGWFTQLIVFASSTPTFIVFGFLLTITFVYIFSRFLPTSQSLRRLEMVSLSPLMSNFGTLVEGLTTIRAFCAQSRFQERVIEVVDNFQKNDHFYWSLQAWLMYRFDTLSACSTLTMTIIAVYMGISPGLTAFVLIAASKFVIHTHFLCKLYGTLEMDFTSVERVVELLDLETETPGVVNPPAWWPSFTGDIVFSGVTIHYAPHLDPALEKLSFRIPGGSNTAVIGRTGSGKSTLALALLATVVPDEGTILIDGVDVATVDRQALRNRVTFLAQDPVLFPGTMRQNLDPLNEYTDEACTSVLAKVAESHNWTLSTFISAGGKGLSQGQRQLVGLARAMLRRSPVVILDEATASIDFETAQNIQRVLREEMSESTVITIAHRLEAVKNADFCIVLGKGKLVQAGTASDMLMEGAEVRGMLA
ncbi:ABC bile acid transporter-like protein [Delitschia confertaspora ATCC 74209]|uniref:ABC bile acid transporter-like protein n=1 Tax=Delitschia confertaspora ATCC 74209 TaxID=1513339 RepID=A0A9P4MWQ9_9PLEO|nr:ABC bile acid transporter-like protein [Delitschia confertaspora ATCC 74209]